jgi:L-ascorbate metabolism protein UlaG (beta-lactamase superfamily)
MMYNLGDKFSGGFMEITWYGHSCFRISERGMATIVTDPYDSKAIGYNPLKLKADIVTISHDSPGHNHTSVVKGVTRLITGPGEYEISGVFITGVQTNGRGKRATDEPVNTLYVFDFEGLTVAHLGDLRRVPSQTEIEALGEVQIALIPVGGGGGLNAAKAAEMVSLLEPGILIPMHYHTPDSMTKLAPLSKFLKEMGVGDVKPELSLKITRTTVPNETRVVVLDYQH